MKVGRTFRVLVQERIQTSLGENVQARGSRRPLRIATKREQHGIIPVYSPSAFQVKTNCEKAASSQQRLQNALWSLARS
jgi:hypothetical protein